MAWINVLARTKPSTSINLAFIQRSAFVCVCVCVCRFYQIVPILIFNLEELIQPLKANRHRP